MTPADADGIPSPSASNDAVRARAPVDTVYPGAILHVPVSVDNDDDDDGLRLDEFVVKAKVKRGLRIVGAEIALEGRGLWRTTVRSRSRSGSSITITASRRRRRPRNGRGKGGGGGGGKGKRSSSSSSSSSFPSSDRLIIATVVLKAVDDKEFFSDDQVRVTWTVEYGGDGNGVDGARRNATQTVLRASRDGVQALVPVVKTTRLLNTALVDGNAVVEPMRVFAVSYTGIVQDISAKATCHSQSRDSLKVSPSCENVYLDGSETHGFSEVTVLAQYTHYLGYTTLAIWVPRLPLKIVLSDRKLSPIRGWKVPRDADNNNNNNNDDGAKQKQSSSSSSKVPCSLKYQQATMRVLAKFLTDGAASSSSNIEEDDDNDGDDSGVKWLLGNGRRWLDVTRRVRTDVKVADPTVATVEKTGGDGPALVIAGRAPGNSMISVISPFTGRILASTPIQVTAFDRVDLIGDRVSVLTGLHVFAEQQQRRHQRQQQQQRQSSPVIVGYLTRFHRFHAVGHKGLLDVELLFSDGAAFPLDAVSPSDYALVVNSLATDVVALSTTKPVSAAAASTTTTTTTSDQFSSSKNQSHVATLVATGEGSGDFLYVSLDSPDACVGKRKQEMSDPMQNLALAPTLTSDYVSVAVGDGISPEYDLAYPDDWLEGGDDYDGFLSDGSFDGYGAHWALPLGFDPSVKETSQRDGGGGSYAYQEFSKLGAVKESRNRKKLFSEGEGFAIKRERTFSALGDYDFDRWHSNRIRDPQDFMPGVSEKRAMAPREEGASKTEIALYVLLAVLAIAVAVLAAHCAVHRLRKTRVVKVKLGHSSSLTKRCATSSGAVATDDDDGDDDSATEDASEDFACADDFVWMSKEALEEAEIPVECTQRLMPEADFVAQTLQRDLPPHHPGQPAITSLSRGNSRTSYAGSRALTHGSSLPIAAHHRGSLPECHHRSRTSSVASSGSRMSNRSGASSSAGSRRHHSDSGSGGGATGVTGEDENPCRFDVSGVDRASSLRSSATRSPLGGVAALDAASFTGSHDDEGADSLRSSRSRASSLLSVTLNPMDEHHHRYPLASSAASSAASAFDRDSFDAATMIPSASSRQPTASTSSSGGGEAASPMKSSISTAMTKRYSPATTSASPATSASPPPGSPCKLAGSPPGSPRLTCSARGPLLKQDSVTSTGSKVLGSICYDYRERGLSFDQMVQYFDHLDETPT